MIEQNLLTSSVIWYKKIEIAGINSKPTKYPLDANREGAYGNLYLTGCQKTVILGFGNFKLNKIQYTKSLLLLHSQIPVKKYIFLGQNLAYNSN